MSPASSLAARGAPAASLPAYELQPPVSRWLEGWLPQMEHWDWQPPPPDEGLAAIDDAYEIELKVGTRGVLPGRPLASALGLRLAAPAAPDLAAGAQPAHVVRRGARERRRRGADAADGGARAGHARLAGGAGRQAARRLRRPGRRLLRRCAAGPARQRVRARGVAVYADGLRPRHGARPGGARLRRHGRPRLVQGRPRRAALPAAAGPAPCARRLCRRPLAPPLGRDAPARRAPLPERRRARA